MAIKTIIPPLLDAMERQHMKYADVARRAHVTRDAVSKWVKRGAIPNGELLNVINAMQDKQFMAAAFEYISVQSGIPIELYPDKLTHSEMEHLLAWQAVTTEASTALLGIPDVINGNRRKAASIHAVFGRLVEASLTLMADLDAECDGGEVDG
jgi:transcriptional regulator with XRE-family HTH domain